MISSLMNGFIRWLTALLDLLDERPAAYRAVPHAGFSCRLQCIKALIKISDARHAVLAFPTPTPSGLGREQTNTPVDIFAVWITFKRRLPAKTDGTSNFDDFIHQTTLDNLLSSSLDLIQTDISSFRVKLTRIASTMDVSDVTPELEQLELDLNTLQEVLQPLLSDVGDISSKMPLLDKAKLYVLVCYAIESLIFCKIHLPYLRLHRSLTDIHLSVVAPKWSGCKKPPRFHRVNPRQAVL